ncbi:hypothetical protein [Pedobacter heparinus]|uniref:hypothetical protein n=1 Tax=Pedobacter heparinus TaxID=984 RepID=UPI00293094E0|nr:hypothetical protein [Pedobacter heparinus]
MTTITSGDCVKIAGKINQRLDRRVSITTLKRVFGFAKTKHSFSKYTLAALVDYVNSEDFVLSIESGSAKPAFSAVLDNQISLHPKQLVLEALEKLLKYDQESLPLIDRGIHLGVVYTKDLIYFLTHDDTRHGTLFHKLNFDLCTATAIIIHRK